MSPPPSRMDSTALLEHMDWARALARRLVADAHVADDLVQEAWLAARRSPPHDPAATRSWLGRVLRNLAHQHRRSEARRRMREDTAAREACVSPDDDLYDRVEIQRKVVECVMQLDEPYRRTVLLRWFEGLGPRAIATREGVPLDTVKSRLQRAHARMRQRLDETYGGDGRSWLLALIPMARFRGPGLLGLGAGTTGALVMSTAKLTLIAASVLALLWGAPRFLRPPTTRAPDVVAIAAPLAEPTSSGGGSSHGLNDAPQPPEGARRTALGSDETRSDAAGQDGGGVIEVQVVAGEDGTPLPGAVVRTLTREEVFTDPFAQLRLLADPSLPFTLMEQRGARHVADEEGHLLVSWSSQGMLLQGESKGRWGSTETGERPSAPVRLELFRNAPLRVKVVDGEGAPVAGVPVDLRTDGRLFGRSVTDSRGIAPIPHAAKLLHDASGDTVLDVSLHLPGVGFEPVRLGSTLPVDPVVLVVPDVGSIEVLCPDLATDELAFVTLAPPDVASGQVLAQSWVVLLEKGRGRFQHVGLGAELEVKAASLSGRPRQRIVRGPTKPGEVVFVELGPDSADESAPRLVGRLLRPDGEPLASAAVRMRLESRTRTTINLTSTLADGSFSWALDVGTPGRPAVPSGGPAELAVEWLAEGPAGVARLPLPELAPGDVDLGEVRLLGRPTLVAGRVVRADGSPASGVRVEVVHHAAVPTTSSYALVPWDCIDELVAFTDGGGAFEVFGSTDQSALYVVAQDDERASEPVAFAPGEKDIVLGLTRTGSVEVTFAQALPWLELGLWAELRPSDGGEALPRPGAISGAVSSARWTGLTHGTYDLVLGLDTHLEPLLEIGPLEVGDGPCVDLRLQQIALGRLFTDATVRVLDPDGDPLEGAKVFVTPLVQDASAGGRLHSVSTGPDGSCLVAVKPGSKYSVDVAANGRPGQRAVIDGDHTFQLERGIETTLQVSGAGPFRDDRWFLTLQFQRADPPSLSCLPLRPIDDQGRAPLSFPTSGRWIGRWVLTRRDDGPAAQALPIEGLERSQIELGVDAALVSQVVDVALPPEVLQAAREQCGFATAR